MPRRNGDSTVHVVLRARERVVGRARACVCVYALYTATERVALRCNTLRCSAERTMAALGAQLRAGALAAPRCRVLYGERSARTALRGVRSMHFFRSASVGVVR